MTRDSADTVLPLHPGLQKLNVVHRRRLRLLSLSLFLVMAGMVMFEMVTAFTSQSAGSLLLLGLIGVLMLPVVMVLGWLLWYLDRALSRSLNAANQLLRDCQPRPVRLAPVEPAGRDGVLATLRPLGANLAQTEPLHALINPSYRWSPPPAGETTVQLYCRDSRPGSELVGIQPNGIPLLGKIVDRAAYDRQRRMLRIAAALVLVGAVLAGILVLGGVGR